MKLTIQAIALAIIFTTVLCFCSAVAIETYTVPYHFNQKSILPMVEEIEDKPLETTEPLEIEPVVSFNEYKGEIIIPAYSFTEEELYLLARLIHSEGGIESYDTQLKIGSVVLNRVLSPYFPNTIEEVIYQENQFSVTTIERNGVLMIDEPADEESIKAACEVLTYGSVLPADVQVFYEKNVNSGWILTREPYGTFDNTTFAYIYERIDR